MYWTITCVASRQACDGGTLPKRLKLGKILATCFWKYRKFSPEIWINVTFWQYFTISFELLKVYFWKLHGASGNPYSSTYSMLQISSAWCTALHLENVADHGIINPKEKVIMHLNICTSWGLGGGVFLDYSSKMRGTLPLQVCIISDVTLPNFTHNFSPTLME